MKKGILVVTGVLLIIASFAILYTLMSAITGGTFSTYYSVYYPLVFVSGIVGAIYSLTGAQKSPGGTVLRIYFVINALTTFVSLTCPEIKGVLVAILGHAICFAGFSILSISNDLGELKSKIIGFVIIAIQSFQLAYRVIKYPAPIYVFIPHIAIIVIDLSLIILIFAKYADKKSRGTK